MENKKAAEVLADLVKRHELSEDEKEAVNMAIGMLSWGALADSRKKAHKARREGNARW